MTLNIRLLVIFGTGVVATVVAAAILAAVGVLRVDFSALSGVATAGISIAVFAMVLGVLLAGKIIQRFSVPFQSMLKSLVSLSEGQPMQDMPASLPAELALAADAFAALEISLQSSQEQAAFLAGQISQDAAGASESFDEIQAGSRVQRETANKAHMTITRLNSDLLEFAKAVEAVSRGIAANAKDFSHMDTSIIHVSQMVNSLNLNLDQASSTSFEDDQSTRNISSDISELTIQTANALDDLRDMTALTNIATEGASDAAQTMNRLMAETEGIGEAIEAVINGTNAVHQANDEILNVTESLESRVGQVDGVIEVIRNLAERTKLLSINASIIASEAGEHGKAFAVVANEVKDLAQSTGGAISEISKIVGDLKDGFSQTVTTIQTGQENVDRGVGLAREAVVVLRTIPEEVHDAARKTSGFLDSTQKHAQKFHDVETVVSAANATLSRVSDVLNRQVSRHSETYSMYNNIKSSLEQIANSTQQNTSMSSSIARAITRLSEDSHGLTDRLRDRINSANEGIRLTESIISTAERHKHKTDEVAAAIATLRQKAASV